MFPNIESEFPLLQLKAFTSHPINNMKSVWLSIALFSDSTPILPFVEI